MKLNRAIPAVVIVWSVLALVACGGDQGSGQPAQTAQEVGYTVVEEREVILSTEAPGRLEAWRVAQIRARVPGIIQSREFRQGSDVEAGELLYRIDPAPYRAAYKQASASLAQARGRLLKAESRHERYRKLPAETAVSKQERIEARADYEAAKAAVAAAEAALETAEINLDYTAVEAPISGRIGRSLVTEGALVGEGEPTHLATIQQIDPIYVSLTRSAEEVLRLRRDRQTGKPLDPDSEPMEVTLRFEDGSDYPHRGRLLFGEASVDPTTGKINFRAEIPNPEGFLLPGMYVRVGLRQARYPHAFLVPQQAVTRNEQGDTLLVIGPDNRLQSREITIVGSRDHQWVVTEGLEDGERVMVDGFQKAGPGAPVEPVLWEQAEDTADSGNGAG
jgi:membrane fusion protein (multidrug efflux system)